MDFKNVNFGEAWVSTRKVQHKRVDDRLASQLLPSPHAQPAASTEDAGRESECFFREEGWPFAAIEERGIVVSLRFLCFFTVFLQRQWAKGAPSPARLTGNQSPPHSLARAAHSANALAPAAKTDQGR